MHEVSDASGLALLRDVLLWRHRQIWLWVAAALVLATAWLALQPYRYTARAALLLDTRRIPATFDVNADTPVDMAVVESQFETLRSDKIAIDVLTKLELWKHAELTRPFNSLLDVFALVGDKQTPAAAKEAVLNNFNKAKSIKRTGRSFLAEISFSLRDPVLAANVANAIAAAYIDDLFQAKAANAQRAGDWMLDRLKNLREQANGAEQAVEDFKARDVGGLTREASGENVAASISHSRVMLKALEAHAQTYKTVYETFLGRTAQLLQQQTFPLTDARVVAEATPPLKPSSPKSVLVLALAGLFGGSIGFVIALGREQLGDWVRTPELLESRGIRTLGSVPLLPGRNLLAGRSVTRPALLIDGGDALRNVKLALDERAGSNNISVGIVSIRSGEGRSTIAYNLATLLAEGAPALLMDCDLHQPELSRKLDRRGRKAKADAAAAPLPDRIVRDSFGFEFLPAPATSSAAHPSQVLTSAHFRELISEARNSYRYCVADLPSLRHVDARAAASMFDVFLLVVEFGAVTTVDIDRALLLSRSVADRLIGAVINKAAVRK